VTLFHRQRTAAPKMLPKPAHRQAPIHNGQSSKIKYNALTCTDSASADVGISGADGARTRDPHTASVAGVQPSPAAIQKRQVNTIPFIVVDSTLAQFRPTGLSQIPPQPQCETPPRSRWPPSAIADAIRAAAWSCGTRGPSGSGCARREVSIRWKYTIARGRAGRSARRSCRRSRVPLARTAAPRAVERVDRDLDVRRDGAADTLNSRAAAEICRASTTSRTLNPFSPCSRHTILKTPDQPASSFTPPIRRARRWTVSPPNVTSEVGSEAPCRRCRGRVSPSRPHAIWMEVGDLHRWESPSDPGAVQ